LKSAESSLFGRITDASRILGFRNVLAHGYDAVSDERVWQLVVVHPPSLIAEVRSLIDEMCTH